MANLTRRSTFVALAGAAIASSPLAPPAFAGLDTSMKPDVEILLARYIAASERMLARLHVLMDSFDDIRQRSRDEAEIERLERERKLAFEHAMRAFRDRRAAALAAA